MNDIELIHEYALHIRVERGLSSNTEHAYTSDLMQFSEFLDSKHCNLIKADKEHVAEFLKHLSEHEIEVRSRARKISTLRRFYRWLIVAERLDKDPMRLTVTPKLPKLLPRPVDIDEMQVTLKRIANMAATDGAGALELRDLAIYEVLYGGGVRVSELCGLREGDVTLNSGVARVLGKGSKERIVPLGDGAITALQNYLELGRPLLIKNRLGVQRALFVSQIGKKLTRRRVGQIVKRLGGEAVHPHRLRHSCATDMLASGADLRAVQEQLGHGSIATTQIYTAVTPGHLQDAHAKFHPRGIVRKGTNHAR